MQIWSSFIKNLNPSPDIDIIRHRGMNSWILESSAILQVFNRLQREQEYSLSDFGIIEVPVTVVIQVERNLLDCLFLAKMRLEDGVCDC